MKTANLSAVESTKKADIIARMQQLVPPGSPEPQDPEIISALQTLTQQLIAAYQADGQLETDPFADVRNRSIYLYKQEVISRLHGKKILITGGEGYVGASLIQKLQALGITQLVSVDKARCCGEETPGQTLEIQGVTYYASDIRNLNALDEIFNLEKPEIVFHLAAQRLPGLAEVKIRETITTSLLGTKNIIQLCEKYDVNQCIFSSTGKASRYYTTEVYAASKKMAEWQFAQAAQEGNVTYGMVRFTHMLENSSFCEQMTNKVQQGKIVNVHAPHRYVTAQNVEEAVHLLLNSVVLSVPGKLKFLTVSNLGWPTETLEVALYKILESGKNLPIYFQGLLPGYEEPFFQGQFDWYKPTDIHLLINVLEDPQRTVDASGDMIVAELAPFSFRTLTKQVWRLEKAITNLEIPEPQLKLVLAEVEKEIVDSICSWASASELLKILKWGTHPKKLQADNAKVTSYHDIVELLLHGLHGRLNKDVLQGARVTPDEFDDMVAILSDLNDLGMEIAYLRSVSRYVREFAPADGTTRRPDRNSPVKLETLAAGSSVKCA